RDLTPPQRLADEAVRQAPHLVEEGVALAGVGKEPLGQGLGDSKVPQGPWATAGITAAVIRVGELPGEGEEYPALGDPAVLGVMGVEAGPEIGPLLVKHDPP